MFYNKSFVNLTMDRTSCDSEPAHFAVYLISSFILSQEPEIAINKSVHKQSVSCHPLFIPPIACRLLCNHIPVRRALILHPGQGFFYGIIKKIFFSGYLSENAGTQQKQWSGITWSSVLFVVYQRRYMTTFSLVFSKGLQYLTDTLQKFLVPGYSYSKHRKHKISSIWFGISPACCTWKTMKWSVCIMLQNFNSGFSGLFNLLLICSFHYLIPNLLPIISTKRLATTR